MSHVAEVSMNEAQTLQLQQKVKEKQDELQQCYMRMEKGEAPSEEVEREYLRMLRDEHRRQTDKELIRMVSCLC